MEHRDVPRKGRGGPGAIGRMTPQRRVILEVLRAAKCHPTADELYARVRERVPRISLATVYRNLDLMARSGLVRKLDLGGPQSRYDGMIEDHCHVRCVHCGCVEDVHAPEPAVNLQEVQGPPGFRVLGHRLEFLGECPRCRS